MRLRVGQGYDVHRLVAGRRLVLGGEEIPHDRGLAGHSDADVLLHALGDALLGAAGLGDLGDHFPPGDEQWRGASSVDLLARIMALVRAAGWRVLNCDLTLIAEAPKLAPYRQSIRERLASLLGVGITSVGLKATTNEGLGALGRGEGMAALAVVLLGDADPEEEAWAGGTLAALAAGDEAPEEPEPT
jgi:2-C-methyl-D-erythritol 2,4-cyclodiphosphate synthase